MKYRVQVEQRDGAWIGVALRRGIEHYRSKPKADAHDAWAHAQQFAWLVEAVERLERTPD